MTSLPHTMPVLVLDAQSQDGTVPYARGAGARVIERAWTDFVDARRFALSQVQTPWALVLDADEELDDVLRNAIVSEAGGADGYAVRRNTYFRGKQMRMWSGERLLRLFKTGAVRIEAKPAAGGEAALHERYVCDGPVRELPGMLLHYSYPDNASYRRKFQSYTSLEAAGVPGSGLQVVRQVALALPRFAWNLTRRGSLLDGPRGWYVAWYSAWYPAVVAWKAAVRR